MEISRTLLNNRLVIVLLAGILIVLALVAAAFLFGGSEKTCSAGNCTCAPDGSQGPVFTSPEEKLRELRDPSFTGRLYAEAVALEPQLKTPGTQVHMGFWSGRGNHGSVLRLLDIVNEGPAATADPPNRAIWNEGANAYYQYPSWDRILSEHWFDRSMAKNGTVTIAGTMYPDPFPVTYEQADAIWGEYSARYAGMAERFATATGRPVKVWCYVEGAKPGRVFARYEYPELRNLEKKGLVELYFARSVDADWERPDDWIFGSANATIPQALT